MATYTLTDIANAQMFSKTNYTIRVIRRMAEKYPHIGTWIEYNIRDATMDDYYIPANLRNSCKMIDVKIPESLCSRLSCNAMKEKSKCTPEEEASYYRVGDDGFDLQCQPACYNTIKEPINTKTNNPRPQMPTLIWNTQQNACRLVDTSIMAWLEKPFYRSDTKYEKRKNDMPTGFSRTIDTVNPFGTGVTYKLNNTYCEYYDKILNDEGMCDESKLDSVLNVVIGMGTINAAASGIRVLTNNGIPFPLPQNLPPMPEQLDPKFKLDVWKATINDKFILPELIDTTPQAPDSKLIDEHTDAANREFKNFYHNDHEISKDVAKRRHAEIHGNYKISNFTRLKMGLPTEDIEDVHIMHSSEFKFKNPEEIIIDAEEKHAPKLRRQKRNADGIPKDGKDGLNNQQEPSKRHPVVERIMMILQGLLKSLFNGNLAKVHYANKLVSYMFKKLKSTCVRITERLTVFLGKGLLKLSGSIGERVFGTGLMNVVVRVVGRTVVNLAAKSAILLAKIVGAASSVVGWILLGTMLMDFVFLFWDPFGYQNMVPKQFPNEFNRQGEMSLRKLLNQPDLTYTFDHLVAVLFDNQELMVLQIESLTDTLIYLDSLVVNSEGSRIDKGPEIMLDSKNGLDGYNEGVAEAMTERVKYNNTMFHEYNKKFMVRVETNKYLNYAGAITLLTSGVLYLLSFNIICLIFLFIAILLLGIARMGLELDWFVDLMLKYRRNTSIYEPAGFPEI